MKTKDLTVNNFEDILVHGSNLSQKESHKRKYVSKEDRVYLQQIRERYEAWKQANNSLKGPFAERHKHDEATVVERVKLLSDYKDFIDQQMFAEVFDSRSNLHSSVLEEFMFYLFRDLIEGFPGRPVVGKSHTFKDFFFLPPSFRDMVQKPYARVEMKDHDFTIGAGLEVEMWCRGMKEKTVALLEVPAVAIECKTYLDKTMLEGSSASAEQLKLRHPNACYIVVSEWLKLSGDVNLKKYKLDQIYVVRQQKNTDREFRYAEDYDKKPINPAVLLHLYETVRTHLTSNWGGGIEEGLERGWLI